MTLLAPTRLFDGETIREGIAVRIETGRITAVLDHQPPEATHLDGLLSPAFIDIQVNGGGGVLFNDTPTLASLRTIADTHRGFGVTSLMATLISDSREKTRAAITAVSEAVSLGVPGILGLHLEGPWLSEPRRGVHPAANLRPLDDADLELLAAKRAFPLLITLAPERVPAEAIRALTQSGVIVSLGHTAASAEVVEQAIAAGATGFTHLFNAMPPLESRNPGPLGAALANHDTFAGLILDGIHVHPISARAAFNAKTARRLILVSDAMATVGATSPSMDLFGAPITLSEGALRTSTGTLAGAHLDLSTAVRNAVSLFGATEAEALRMATSTPAEFLGLTSRGRIVEGARADLVLLDEGLNAAHVWDGAEMRG